MSKKNKVTRKKRGFGKEADTLLENLAMLAHSGAPLAAALDSLSSDLSSKKLKKATVKMVEELEDGMPFWKSLGKSGIASTSTLSLVKSGEQSGRLSENLELVARQQQKDRIFKSHIRSAMIYPAIVLIMAFFIGLALSWFLLPRLVSIFDGLNAELPLPTKVLIEAGNIMSEYGLIIVSGVIAFIILSSMFVYIFRPIRVGIARFLLKTPGVRRLVTEVEIARMGHTAGTLLEAGLPVDTVFSALKNSTNNKKFIRLYVYLADGIDQGKGFSDLLKIKHKYNKILPTTVRSVIATGEKSGSLSKAFMQISKIYEEKVDTTSKNLSIILEPILLVMVWLVVVALALAIILPIYSLIGNLNSV
jgi:type IV pilus assembly protein PilC